MIHLTDEQQAIIQYPLQPQDVLKIMAFAGTGKTTTLVYFAQARPQWRFLYVAFNKAVQLAATRSFPDNVLCKTTHSLAWPQYGAQYRDKLIGTLRVNRVMEALELTQVDEAKMAMETLGHFLVSAAARIEPHHIPELAHTLYASRAMPDFVQLAERLWYRMQQPENTTVGMLHDGYLKLYQQSHPVLDFDCILLDEAQDTNPVTADVLLHQACARVLVGDPHQQIYRFRGAVDAMDGVEASTTIYLTQSFRFGAQVAQLANHVLRTFKAESKQIEGCSGEDSIGPVAGPHTVIARTNAAVFEEAVALYPWHWLGFVGGLPGYRFSLIVDTYYLYARKPSRIRDDYIKSFRSFAAMKDFAETVQDWELTSRCKIVKKYHHQIPKLVARITAKAVETLDEAEVVLTTAHKAKGLEFPQVKLTDDFMPLMQSATQVLPKDKVVPDEVNLLYVAMTRTQARLELPGSLARFHQFMGTPERLMPEFPPASVDGTQTSSAPSSSATIAHPVSQPALCPHLNDLQRIPGVGPRIAQDLWDLGLHGVSDLKDQDPEALACRFEALRGVAIDDMRRCVFRCAVYYASRCRHQPELLQWWNWKSKAGMAKR